jgi:hypothetical protein
LLVSSRFVLVLTDWTSLTEARTPLRSALDEGRKVWLEYALVAVGLVIGLFVFMFVILPLFGIRWSGPLPPGNIAWLAF